jgi:hypothetical protein
MVSIECEGSEAALFGARCEIVGDKTSYLICIGTLF